MDSLFSLVENVQRNVLGHFLDNSAELEKQQLASDANKIYDEIGSREDVQNLITKYRLQLFQIKEVNEEIERRANVCSTRCGRVQQTLTEYSKQVERLEQMLRQSQLANLTTLLEEMAKQIYELERHGLQTELAMFELEKLASSSGNKQQNGKRKRDAAAGDGAGSEEELLGQH